MTSKLKCPVCNVPLTECGDLLSCPNDHCGWVGNAALWQALIQEKQDLIIAKSTLEYLGYEFPPAYPEKNVIAEMRQKARNAVKQITHDNKGIEI